MPKFGVFIVLIILSFFINLLYYTCWMLTDAWLLSDAEPIESNKSVAEATEGLTLQS